MRTVLLPTDFSENAFNAITYAVHLFKHEQIEFKVLHAYADEVYEQTHGYNLEAFELYKSKVEEASDRHLQETVNKMRVLSPNPKHNYTYESSFSTLIDCINSWVEKTRAEVVVMGTQGKSSDTKEFGSYTVQTMKYVRCPVIAVPKVYHEPYPKRILFPTDFNVPFKKTDLKLVSTIAKNFACKVQFLYVTGSDSLSLRQQKNIELLADFFTKGTYELVQKDGLSLVNVINEYVENNQVDLLTMVNHHHSFLEDLLYHQTITRIAHSTQIPFLVLQNLDRSL